MIEKSKKTVQGYETVVWREGSEAAAVARMQEGDPDALG